MNADEAYANSAHIPDGESYYARWDAAAEAFRSGQALKELNVPYGAGPRQCYDIFHPKRAPKGTVVVLHGGYWLAGSPAMFSHLAAGAVAAGYSCALPGYTLAPDARIAEITQEAAVAIQVIAARTRGPLYLVGHSAGAHLAARMGCLSPAPDWLARVARIMPISVIGDLEPLMQTSMNETLQLDAAEAEAESLVFRDAPDVPVTIWVGEGERPAFLDQAQRLADRWACAHIIEPDRHHFDVIEGLERPDSPLMQALFR